MNYEKVSKLIDSIIRAIDFQIEVYNEGKPDEEDKGILQGYWDVLFIIDNYLGWEKCIAEPEDIQDIEKMQEKVSIEKYMKIIDKKKNEV